MRTIDEEGYKYLVKLEYDKVKEKVLRSKLNRNKKIKAINSWAVVIMRYGARVSEWRFDELKELDSKTRKLLTIHKGLHP